MQIYVNWLKYVILASVKKIIKNTNRVGHHRQRITNSVAEGRSDSRECNQILTTGGASRNKSSYSSRGNVK